MAQAPENEVSLSTRVCRVSVNVMTGVSATSVSWKWTQSNRIFNMYSQPEQHQDCYTFLPANSNVDYLNSWVLWKLHLNDHLKTFSFSKVVKNRGSFGFVWVSVCRGLRLEQISRVWRETWSHWTGQLMSLVSEWAISFIQKPTWFSEQYIYILHESLNPKI